MSLVLCAATAATEIEIRSPGFSPSRVGPDGSVLEPWGAVTLRLVSPDGAKLEQRQQDNPMPAAVTVATAGSVKLSQTAYRAPIWPAGCDVVQATIENCSDQSAETQIELAVPPKMAIGETVGVIDGRPSLALPTTLQATRQRRDWGCMGGITPLRGWAKPDRPCDPAFKNISAGLGGVPIKYQFRVQAGAAKTLVLGFCESHHEEPAKRIMVATAEGAPPQKMDPIARWGRHVPGLVRFEARDVDHDGLITVAVAPDASAADRNPILNVIWLFGTTAPPDDAILAGNAGTSAEHYVDVGGDKDQSLYPPGNLKYTIPLLPREKRTILLSLRCPDGGPIPDPTTSAWTTYSLHKAAADVWRDRWAEPVATPAPTSSQMK